MAFCLLAKPSPTRALLICRLRCKAPLNMRATSFLPRLAEFSSNAVLLKASKFSGRTSASSCTQGWILVSGAHAAHAKHKCFCSSSGSQHQAGDSSNAGQRFQGQQPTSSSPLQQQQFAAQHPQQPANPSGSIPNTAGQQPRQSAPSAVNQGIQQSSAVPAGPSPSTSSAGGASSPPRTSAAAEVIDKYLGPSTLKLEKRDDRSPPPPPPPRRSYGPQGNQEKKSGKDLVAESAACAVIEKYLGPWPGFPPRDPKIDEYLDSLPENAACAAIDKYFGPYKPLFVFKKNEENANNPPPPSRPPRSRMMNRARNRQWNASQQGASVDRPWTAPQQQGSAANVPHAHPNVGESPLQAAPPSSTSAQSVPLQQKTGMPPQPGHSPSQAGAVPLQEGGASPQDTYRPPPRSGASG